MKKKTWLSWSSGKDSAWALHILRQDPAFDVTALFTVVNAKHQRAAMHSTRLDLLRLQADAAGLPLHVVEIPDPCTFEECNAIIGECHDVDPFVFRDVIPVWDASSLVFTCNFSGPA